MTQGAQNCRQCGAALSPDDTRGLCPACLLETSLAQGDEPDVQGPVDTAGLERNQLAGSEAPAAQIQRLGDYQLLEEIGRGGMGVINEVVQVGGQNYIMPIVKLSDDSDISVNNFPSMYLITGSIASSTYIQSGTVVVYGNGFVSLLNSTYTPLGANGVFTGTVENVVEYSSIIITVHPDQASKVDGLEFQFSPNGTVFETTDTYRIGAGLCKTYALQPISPYFRIDTPTGRLLSLRLHCMFNIKKLEA